MNRNIVKRVLLYCLGLLLLAFGVTFSIKSNLGVSPVNSIPYVLSIVFVIDQGLLTVAVFCSYILLQIILLRKDFKMFNLLQIVFSGIFGYFVTFSNSIWTFNLIDNYISRLILLLISIIFIALGLLFYLTANIVPQPAEGLMLVISKKTNLSFLKTKIIFDCTVVIISLIISFLGTMSLIGIREGTIIAALVVGKVLEFFTKKFKPFLIKLISSKETIIVSQNIPNQK